MAVLLNVILPVILVAGVAALAQRYVKLDLRTTSRAAFYLFAPALVFDSLVSSTIGGAEFGQIAVALIGVTLALWGLGEGLGRLLHLLRLPLPALLNNILPHSSFLCERRESSPCAQKPKPEPGHYKEMYPLKPFGNILPLFHALPG